MYVGVIGATTATVATSAALSTLPNTGGNLLLNIALSVAAGMTAWGVLYARSR